MGVPSTPAPVAAQPTGPIVLDRERGKGLQIRCTPKRSDGHITLQLVLENFTSQPLAQFAIKLNKNFLGVSPASTSISLSGPIEPQQWKSATVILNEDGEVGQNQPGLLQVAMKSQIEVHYFNVTFVSLFLLNLGLTSLSLSLLFV